MFTFLYISNAIGFDVTVVDTENMGGHDFRRTMMNFSLDEKHGDIMVLVVMSHGEEGGPSGQILTSKNGERIDIEYDIFRSEIFFPTNYNTYLLKILGCLAITAHN